MLSLMPSPSFYLQTPRQPTFYLHRGGTGFPDPFQHLRSWPARMDGMDVPTLIQTTKKLCVPPILHTISSSVQRTSLDT